MDKLIIHSRKGLLHGRTYLWYGEDLLVIEGNLCKKGQRAAIEEAAAHRPGRSPVADPPCPLAA